MSEMVERVARNINEMIANLAHPVGMGIGLPEQAAQAVAVIAIAAMREPTAEMIEAADEICPIARGTESHRISGGKVPEDYWHAMIDAALD